MKLPMLLLAGSLAVNGILLGLFAFHPALAPPAVREFFRNDAQRTADQAAKDKAERNRSAARGKSTASQQTSVWSSLQADDLKTLITRLRAAGFSPVVVRAVVNARLEATFSARMQELVGALDVPFWKPDPQSSYNNPKYYETQSQIYRDRARALFPITVRSGRGSRGSLPGPRCWQSAIRDIRAPRSAVTETSIPEAWVQGGPRGSPARTRPHFR